jgi:hypothetical protein
MPFRVYGNDTGQVVSSRSRQASRDGLFKQGTSKHKGISDNIINLSGWVLAGM